MPQLAALNYRLYIVIIHRIKQYVVIKESDLKRKTKWKL